VLKFIDEPTFTNHKKNDFTALQLFNAAKQKLILSTPLLYANEQSDQSQYLKFLIDRGVKPITKYGVNLNETIEQIGNYDGLLSNLGQIERLLMKDLNSTKIPFWSSLFRMMAKHSDYQRVLLSVQSDSLQERRLESSVISALYPTDLNASVSSFEKFYNCEYQYFLSQTLHLQEFERIDLDSRISGSYFHEVFEILMRNSNKTSEEFDSKLTRSLHEVDNKYLSFFTRDATSRYTWTKLQEIIKQTATLLKQTVNHSAIHSLAFEQGFGFEQSGIETYQVALQDDKNLKLRGMIDRVDQIFNTLGAIDYKSGNKKFDLQAVYEGVSLQFLTYLAILRKNAVKFNTEPTIWGALYLRLQNPIISLSGINQTREISSELKKIMKYTGFFNTEFASDFEDYFSDLFNLGQFTKEGIPFKNNHYFYTETEISSLINHNEALYQTAGQKILSGKIAINPVAIKHHVKGCQFCHFKSICGFEADNHFLSARKINTKSREEIKQLLLAGGTENASSK
jgi:ATP-dependent helicase/nuclease subunit B